MKVGVGKCAKLLSISTNVFINFGLFHLIVVYITQRGGMENGKRKLGYGIWISRFDEMWKWWEIKGFAA